MAALTPHEMAEAIVQCAYDAVPHDNPWPIGRTGVVIGEIAWDNCECGQLVISETRRYPSRDFPLDEVAHTSDCGAPYLVVEYTLSLTRCVAINDDNGYPPSVALLTASAERNSLDMTAVRHAVLCCLDEQYREHELVAYELGAMDVTGPGGMCAGFDFNILVGWTNDCGCT